MKLRTDKIKCSLHMEQHMIAHAYVKQTLKSIHVVKHLKTVHFP